MKHLKVGQAEIGTLDSWGGKARTLAELAAAGMPVPDGWVVAADAFSRHVRKCDAGNLVEKPFGIELATEELLAEVQYRVLTTGMEQNVIEGLEGLPPMSMAVRSSAQVEDQASGSYSGLFESVLGVVGVQALASAVKKVWASVFTAQVAAYHSRMRPGEPLPRMAVLVMPMVAADTAGVASSANPVDGNPFRMAVSVCRGLGTTVVEGREQCGRYLMDIESLDIVDFVPGTQTNGLFLKTDGRLETRVLRPDNAGAPLCTGEQFARLGEIVRTIDSILDSRVDVEFAIVDDQVSVLQARPLVGLPPCFPDNPVKAGSRVFPVSDNVLYPFAEAEFVRDAVRPFAPSPPWALEVTEFIVRHGRLFVRLPEHPEWPEDPDSGCRDKTFLHRMMALEQPADDLRSACEWAQTICTNNIPTLRQQAEAILRWTTAELGGASLQDLRHLLLGALELSRKCRTLYVSASGGTWETIRRIGILAGEWIGGIDWKACDVLAGTLIKGAPKLTHERDAQLELVAAGAMSEEAYACRWGYGYLNIEDMHDIARWRSWREDPTPVRVAVSLLGKQQSALGLAHRVQLAAEQADTAFKDALERIGPEGEVEANQRRRVFAACVQAARIVFPLKDNRDLVLAHAQSALRWVLMEIGRRLAQRGVAATPDDVFMLTADEIADVLNPRDDSLVHVASLMADRRRKLRRVARYRLPMQRQTQPEQPRNVGSLLQAWPASPGIAEGRARVVDSVSDVRGLQPGEILCLLGDRRVGWTMYFPIIAGLVYEDGNWLCHETNLCRELGIPAVVGAGAQLRAIRDGELLRIDGSQGTITRKTPSGTGGTSLEDAM
ncbi:MAG: hypothetical protein GF331_15750 [Chitinivibrionales bacterium]|nr:hypothetical protein [Chitinivibrionales bacterium]